MRFGEDTHGGRASWAPGPQAGGRRLQVRILWGERLIFLPLRTRGVRKRESIKSSSAAGAEVKG